MKNAESVYKLVAGIPKGKVLTYGMIARATNIGPRQVGRILHENPYPREEVPCHRVVNAQGKLAKTYAFGGDGEQKNMLLSEGVQFKNNKVDLKNSLWLLPLKTNRQKLKIFIMNWIVFALLSALFAALTSILAKVGIKGVDSNVATAIRTIVILLFAWGIVLFQGTWKQIGTLSSFSIVFLVLSGLATGLSWLFYFRALQLGQASQVAPIDKLSLALTVILAMIFLKEKINLSIGVGVVLMLAGTYLIAFGK